MTITRSQYEELLRAYENSKPREAIREELGGGYYYRCPWLACNKIVRSEWDYCPYCGVKLLFNDDY